MARLENWQPSERSPYREGLTAIQLSQSTQMLFQGNADSNRSQLPLSLDFGTESDLYLSSADTSLASSIMTENSEQKLDDKAIPKTPDATAEVKPGKPDAVVAVRDDYLDRNEPAERSEKKVPRDGIKPHLKEFLDDYKSPVMDAYEHSKSLKNGEPGKSKTLEDIIDRLKDCPWLSKLFVKYDSKASNPEYDNFESTITLRPQDTARQIENFAHEGFHATHQFLSRLYDHGKIGPEEFVNIFMNGEVESMLVEARVQRDLDPKGEPTKFYYYRADNGQKDSINVLQYAQEHSRQGLLKFLRTAQPTGQNEEPYGKHYSKYYKSYVDNFDQNKPAVDNFIKQWVASGRKRDDI